MTAKCRALALGACGVLVAGCGDAPPASCEALVSGIPVVGNEGPGAWETEARSPALVELWRRGGTNEGEELALPISAAASPAGRLAIPDFQLGEITVIEADGTWNASWARQGQGPGEVSMPVAVTWGVDGTLTVFDIGTGKVLSLRDGAAVGEDLSVHPAFFAPLVMGGALHWLGVQPGGAVLLFSPFDLTSPLGEGSESGAAILRLGPGETLADTISKALFPTVSAAGAHGWPVPGWPQPTAGVGADGVLVTGATDGTYRLLVFDASGRATRQVCRATDPLPLSTAERGDSVPDDLERSEALGAALRDAPRPPRSSPFGRVIVGARGRIWVQRERGPAYPGSLAGPYGQPGGRHDVFAADGEYLGEIRLPSGAALQAAAGDTIWAFQMGGFDEVWVIAYALTLRASARGGV